MLLKPPERIKELILYIDDEEKNLESFKIIFRKDYEVLLATSAKEGMDLIRQNKIKLVITDQRMPKMTGVELLEWIADLYPDVSRVILTGYSDEKAIISAINKGQVFRYVTKPWKKEELKKTIDYALEAYRLRVENKELMEKLKKANDELDEFVYRASHDLRAPLASVMGLIDLAKEEEDIAKLKEYNTLKEQNLLKLDLILKDIISFSKNSHLQLIPERIFFEQLIVECFQYNDYLENADSVDKTYTIAGEGVFISDRFRLSIILNNLISNAIKYCQLSKVPKLHIEVSLVDGQAVIAVEDNGKGISEDQLSKIFDMFHRGIAESTGAGLGLFIVKEAVYKLKGSIDVTSVEEEGSKFIVTLPTIPQGESIE